MNLGGFARTLQADFVTLLGTLIFIGVATALLSFLFAGCEKYYDVPPNDIGMKLTPSGYEDKIYSPGQVDLGTSNNDGQLNKLVLIQRSGVEVKEQFLSKSSSEDKEDHR